MEHKCLIVFHTLHSIKSWYVYYENAALLIVHEPTFWIGACPHSSMWASPVFEGTRLSELHHSLLSTPQTDWIARRCPRWVLPCCADYSIIRTNLIWLQFLKWDGPMWMERLYVLQSFLFMVRFMTIQKRKLKLYWMRLPTCCKFSLFRRAGNTTRKRMFFSRLVPTSKGNALYKCCIRFRRF